MFTDIFIKKPVLAVVICMTILMLGLWSSTKLGLRLFPKVELPMININTAYPGADAELVQSTVTSPLQQVISNLEGVNYITSSSSKGSSSITVNMRIGSDITAAINELSNKVNSIRASLPPDGNNPQVYKNSTDNSPLMILAFSSSQMSRFQVADYLQKKLASELESIPGVSRVSVLGGSKAMRVWLNPAEMAAYGITTAEIKRALQEHSIQSTTGNTDSQFSRFSISTDSELHDEQQFKDIVIKNTDDAFVTLGDIATITIGPQSENISAFFNGKLTTLVFVQAQEDASPIKLARTVTTKIQQLNHKLPLDLKADIVLDTSTDIANSLHEVLQSILEATLIVSLVVFVFVGTARVALIPIVAIPLSLIGSLAFMWLLGYTANTITLLAMVIAIGLVVDDAIIVVENIYRHIENGVNYLQAALMGAREIATPIIAMTLILAVVYLPIGFSSGLSGIIFTEFAITLSATVLLSGVIALVLSPMLCAQLLKQHHTSTGWVTRMMGALTLKYRNSLAVVLRHSYCVMFIMLAVVTGLVTLYQIIPKELAPEEDQSFLEVFATAPQSNSSDFLASQTRGFGQIFTKMPGLVNYITINGIPNQYQSLAFLSFNDQDQRPKSTMQMRVDLQQDLSSQIVGLRSAAILPGTLPGDEGMPVAVVLKSTLPYKQMYNESQKLIQTAQQSGIFTYLTADLNYEQPNVGIHINRDHAEKLNVPISAITDPIAMLYTDYKVQQFSSDGKTYDVIAKVDPKFQRNPNELNYINVKSRDGINIPLSDLIEINYAVQPDSLNQFQKLNSVTVSGSINPSYSLGDALAYLNKEVDNNLSKEITIDYAGSSRQFIQEGHELLYIFLASLLAIYFVLTIQFNSFLDPLIIIFGSVPTAMFGAISVLYLTGNTLNIYTEIGLLTLIGLISKHGILLLNSANTFLKEEAISTQEAIIRSATLRIRPIIMTTVAMTVGVLPLLLARGSGRVSRHELGLTLAVGILIGTIFTLYFVPMLCCFVKKYYASNKVEIGKFKLPSKPCKIL